jgi:long-chain acyl-CoA synthetase
MIVRCEDSDAAALTGPGGPYATHWTDIGGVPCEVYRDHPATLPGIFAAARTRASRPMVADSSQAWTHVDVFRIATALSATLQSRFGVIPRTRVAIVVGSRMEWVAAFIAITQIGGVAVVVNTRGSREEMAHAIALTNCEVVLADSERAASLREGDAPWPMILIDAAGHLRSGKDLTFDAAASETAQPTAVAIDSEDEAAVLFTSGTTGFPKGALLNHRALCHAAVTTGITADLQDLRYEAEFKCRLDSSRPSRASPTILPGPMFHIGAPVLLLRGMYFGGPLFLLTKWKPDTVLDLLEGERPRWSWFAPAMMWDLLNSPRSRDDRILGVLRHLINGAAALPEALVREIGARMPGVLLWASYGSTEASGAVAMLGGRELLQNPNCCGRLLPTMRLRIVRDDGSDALSGEPGEICLSGANVFSGYVNDPTATDEALQGGWLRTGDIGHMDAQGRLSIVDRKKNVVISGGENIYCAEVERVLSDHEAVGEVVAYGVPEPRLGERLVVTVVLKPGAVASGEQLQTHVRKHLAIYKIPREVHFTREPLPRTALGKIDRSKFKAKQRG